MGNKNYNTVNVEVPVAGEYILTINEHMLIVKCIDETMKQYSEFTKIENSYIMTSVNYRSGNIMRFMEEFCKIHNCPKKILRDALNEANEEFNNRYHNIYYSDLDDLKQENKSLKIKLSELEETINIYKLRLIVARETIIDSVVNCLTPVISEDDIVNNINISYDSDNTSDVDKSDNSKLSSTKKSSNSHIRKSDKASTNTIRPGGKPGAKGKINQRITKEDSDVILEMWKTMTSTQIANEFPQYTKKQICHYCSLHSDFNKYGLSKEFIKNLRSHNGEKTLKELSKIYGKFPSDIRKICERYNIPYKEEA